MGIGMKLRARFVDVETGETTALLHIDDAQDMALREQDRVRIVHEGKAVTAIINTSDTVIDKGEVGLLGRAFKTIGPEPGSRSTSTRPPAPSRSSISGRKWTEGN